MGEFSEPAATHALRGPARQSGDVRGSGLESTSTPVIPSAARDLLFGGWANFPNRPLRMPCVAPLVRAGMYVGAAWNLHQRLSSRAQRGICFSVGGPIFRTGRYACPAWPRSSERGCTWERPGIYINACHPERSEGSAFRWMGQFSEPAATHALPIPLVRAGMYVGAAWNLHQRLSSRAQRGICFSVDGPIFRTGRYACPANPAR